jgi:hypothetical protein
MNALPLLIPIIALFTLWLMTRANKRYTSPKVKGASSATDIRVGSVNVTNVLATGDLNMTTTRTGV